MIRARAPDEVDRLETPWRVLDARGGCPSSHFGWTRACLTAFSDQATIEIIAAMRGGELAAIAPLVRRRLHGVHRLLPAGAGPLREPMDLAWEDEVALRRLAVALARSRSPLLLARMRADSQALAAIRRACRGRALVVVRPDTPHPYIELDESWMEPQRHLNGYCRDMLRTARQRAEQLGPVATAIHTPGLHELPELLNAAFEVAARGCQETAAGGPFKDPHRAVFYRQYAEAACVAGTLRICFLRIGDRVAAAQVAVESGDGFWLLMAGADDRYAGCAPGQLLARETIRYAAEANLSSYEFWGRAEPWTQAWTARRRSCVSLRVYPFGLSGLAALVADAVAAGWHRWRKR
jgi:CelD/BcsL family acetyltransferase involved in cellulose biosynthesis